MQPGLGVFYSSSLHGVPHVLSKVVRHAHMHRMPQLYLSNCQPSCQTISQTRNGGPQLNFPAGRPCCQQPG